MDTEPQADVLYVIDKQRPGFPEVALYDSDKLTTQGSTWEVLRFLAGVLRIDVRVTENRSLWWGGQWAPKTRGEVDRRWREIAAQDVKRARAEAAELRERADQLEEEATYAEIALEMETENVARD